MTPDEHTNQEFWLDVGDSHRIYVQDWGKADAKLPIIYLHGGPGGGVKHKYKAGFEPGLQRVIFFDQRGSGKSLPYGSLTNNTTQHLIEDIRKIANHLKIKKFILTGGSWGSCLALAYAVTYPDQVAGLVIQGVFTGSKDEIDWLAKGRFRDFFPDAWDKLLADTPSKYHENPTDYHFERALSDDQEAAKASAYAYETLELSLLRLDDRYTPADYETYDLAKIRTEIHYIVNNCFLADRHILNNVAKLKMPVWLVQGRYDMVCRPKIAYELHKKLPKSELILAIDGHVAGHETANILKLANRHLSGAL
jgi:proline iminopeptidase